MMTTNNEPLNRKCLVLVNLLGLISSEPEEFPSINGFLLSTGNTQPYLNAYPDLWSGVGSILKLSIDARIHLVKEISFEDQNLVPTQVHADLSGLDAFFNFLWFAKDHNVHFKQLLGYENSEYRFLLSGDNQYSKADGTLSLTNFTSDDFKTAIDVYKSYSAIDFQPKSHRRTIKQGDGTTDVAFQSLSEYNELNRIQRAYKFLKLARTNIDLGLKISFYILLLECLFSADEATEVTYKVSLRTAFYSFEDTQERETVFELVKECYGLRSSFFHGQKFKSRYTIATLSEKSIKLDSLVRHVFKQVVLIDSQNFLLDDKALTEYFRKFIFAPVSSQTPPSAAE